MSLYTMYRGGGKLNLFKRGRIFWVIISAGGGGGGGGGHGRELAVSPTGETIISVYFIPQPCMDVYREGS